MTMEEEFVQLKWNTHQLAFLNTLSTLRDKQVYTDVTLSCGDQFYPAHRLVLSACSTFLARTLEVAGCKAPVILLHGVDQSTLEQLLMFMYDGQVTIAKNDLPKLLKAAKWLEVKGLDSDLDKYKINEGPSENQSSSEQLDSNHLDTWNQLFSSFTSTNLQEENMENVLKLYKQITSEMKKNGGDNDQCLDVSETETGDTTKENESQDNISSSNSDDKSLTNSTLEDGKDSCYNSQEIENNDSNSFHGWMEPEIDTKEHLRILLENATPAAETNQINFSSVPDESFERTNEEQINSTSVADESTEMTKENNGADMKKRSLKCKHCRKSFGVRKNLARHLRTHHNQSQDQTTSYCFTCQTSFSNKNKFLRHMKLHKAQKLHYCSYCDFVSHSLFGLKKHILVQHRSSSDSNQTINKVQLTEESKFTSKDVKKSLQHTDKPRCPTCSKKFYNDFQYKQHVDKGCKGITRSNEGYHCPLCTYVADRLRSVEDHVARHTGVYPFNCSYCSYKSIRKHFLVHHMNKRHPDCK